jgi:hypothetical protein
MGVQDLLEEKLLKEGVGEGPEQQEDSAKAAILLTANDIHTAGLSITNQVDTDLVVYLASTITDRNIQIQKTWWSLASCLWS